MNHLVELTVNARADLHRIFDFTFDRELARDGGDLQLADKAMDAIFRALRLLERAPFSYRRASEDASLRELVIPFGGAGFVATFAITEDSHVRIVAIRHQREDGDAA